MEFEFTVEQMNQIVRAARVLASGFTEERLRWLISGQKRLAESGFCEAVWALVRLEREMGVSISQALDAAKGLVRDNANLKAANARLEKKNVTLQAANQELEQRNRQLREERATVQAETEKQERRLVALRQGGEREKKRIDREVERCRQKANVTEQEIATAGELKAKVARSGFSLEQMLDLSTEFAGHKDTKDRLAEGLKKHDTLTGYIAAMEQQAEEERKVLNSELAGLRAQADRERTYGEKLEEDRYILQSTITQLQVDVAHEQELRRFYEDYHELSQFLDYLADWDPVAFLRCNNPISGLANALNPSGMAHFCTDRQPVACPHCRSEFIADAKAYQALNMPLGSWVKFRKGEV